MDIDSCNQSINKELIQRLSQYKSVLYKLRSLGFVRVFSDNLADALGISSSLVRKDFASFQLRGNKRGGYQVEELIRRLREILGKNEARKIIIVGCGKIGRALINYNSFKHDGIQVVAGFDVNPAVLEPEARVPILDMAGMEEFVQREQIKVAVIAVPEAAATQVMDSLKRAGIKGVLNFAPIALKDGDGCIIHNINIRMEVENLFNYLHICENVHSDPLLESAATDRR